MASPSSPAQQQPKMACYTMLEQGSCKFGDACRYSHDPNAPKGEDKRGQPRERKPRVRKPRAERAVNQGENGNGAGAGAEQSSRPRRKRGPKGPKQDPKEIICKNMKQDGECKYGDECRFSHDLSIDEAALLAAHKAAHPPAAASASNTGSGSAAPRQQRQPRERDTERESAPRTKAPRDDSCYTFRDEGACKFGDACRFRHGTDDHRDLALLKRRANGVCYAWRDNNECKFEDKCRFAHEHLAASA